MPTTKNKNRLTHAQITRLAGQARQSLSHAQTMAKCLPDELGCTLAEDFAESGIEQAAAAIALLARIKCALRIERIEGRINAVLSRLAPHEVEALCAVGKEDGCSVNSPALARTLQAINGRFPDLMNIGPVPADSAGCKPYFGVILKPRGRELIDYVKRGAA